MKCPVCKKEEMIVLELESVEIDYCLSCKGIWLDCGELELLLESAGDREKALTQLQPTPKSKENTKPCPICLRKMDKVIYPCQENIILDKCRKSHGLWFDRGELYKLIKSECNDKDNRVAALLREMFQIRLNRTQAR